MLKLNHIPNNGSAMLAIFCDLSDEDKKDFRPWLAEDMFPARLNIGFTNCASFSLIEGNGSEFVTLYETPSLGHLYNTPYQELRQKRTPRDAEYHKKFQNPERYTLTWVGPEISQKKSGFAPYISVERFDIKNNLIGEFNSWFVSTYIPTMLNSKNRISLRRYMSVEGPHKNFVIQEFTDSEISANNKPSNLKNSSEISISGIYKRIIQSP